MTGNQLPNKMINDNYDSQPIIEISRGYIQDFVEANYGRKLTEAELEELSWLVWDNGDYDLMCWIDAAVNQIVKTKKRK